MLNRAKVSYLDMDEKVKREIWILQRLNHPHISRLYEVIETPTDIFLIMEYVSGGELFDYIVSRGRLHEDEARLFFQQLVSAIAYCHCHRVVHRDLKPENLLLAEGSNLKVADFGLSNFMLDGEFLRTSCGSPNYAAPEVISGNLYAGPEVDVWSCGVILYALLCGSLPFDDESIPRLFKKIKGGVYTLPSHLSAMSRDLIPRMLVVDPMKRISIQDIRSHPWFTVRLPRYLSISPKELVAADQARIAQLDDDAIDDVMEFDFSLCKLHDRDEVVRVLLDNFGHEVRVAYELVVDKKLKVRMRAEQREVAKDGSSEGNVAFPSDPSRTSVKYPRSFSEWKYRGHVLDSGVVNNSAPGNMQPTRRRMSNSPVEVAAAKNHAVQQSPRQRRWYLGIQSKKDPAHVMAEVFRALRTLDCTWTVLSPYRLISRWANSDGEMLYVYVALQLYKVQQSVYLLDFQRVGSEEGKEKLQTGGVITFMNVCSMIIHALKTGSSRRPQ